MTDGIVSFLGVTHKPKDHKYSGYSKDWPPGVYSNDVCFIVVNHGSKESIICGLTDGVWGIDTNCWATGWRRISDDPTITAIQFAGPRL